MKSSFRDSFQFIYLIHKKQCLFHLDNCPISFIEESIKILAMISRYDSFQKFYQTNMVFFSSGP